jgi:LysM repeat protein
MNTPSPLVPQGSLLEQQAKSKPHLRIALFILAIHVLFLGGLLMQGCKRDDETPGAMAAITNGTTLPPLDGSNLYTLTPSPAPALTNLLATEPPITNAQVLPEPPAPQPTPAPSAVQEYTVARGDSFYSIGKKFGLSANAIAKANPGIDPIRLKVGQKLQVPAGAAAGPAASTPELGRSAADTYVVKSGDTLSRIARTHNVSLGALREVNALKTDRIYPGQKLKLPARAGAAPAPAPEPVNFGTPLPGPSGPTPQ